VARSRGYWPFRACYEDGLRREGPLDGKVLVQLWVSAEGDVERASVQPSTVRDPAVALCIAREARHLSFAPPGSPLASTMEVTLSEGDEPVAQRHRVPHAGALLDALRAAWPAVRQCYADGLALRPDAGGTMQLRFRAFADGQVADVTEVVTRFDTPDVARCVVDVYRSVRLPPRGGPTGDRDFVYALHFEAAEGEPKVHSGVPNAR
jgi:hypothetical protein